MRNCVVGCKLAEGTSSPSTYDAASTWSPTYSPAGGVFGSAVHSTASPTFNSSSSELSKSSSSSGSDASPSCTSYIPTPKSESTGRRCGEKGRQTDREEEPPQFISRRLEKVPRLRSRCCHQRKSSCRPQGPTANQTLIGSRTASCLWPTMSYVQNQGRQQGRKMPRAEQPPLLQRQGLVQNHKHATTRLQSVLRTFRGRNYVRRYSTSRLVAASRRSRHG